MKNDQSSLRQTYIGRINKVMDFIDNHLDQSLDLDTLAEVALFSRYHFHRIFRAIVGEPLNQYVQRIRLEKAATQLVFNPDQSITEIALNCGFSSSATFARAFKDGFGMSASEWRKQGEHTESKIGKTESKTGKAHKVSPFYLEGVFNNHLQWNIMMDNQVIAQVEVKSLPETHVAYIRHVGPYQGDGALFERLFNELMKWAGPRGLLNFPQTQMMSIYHEDPKVTDDEKLRLTVAISVPEDTKVDGKIGKMTLPGGQYAVSRFELAENEYEQAWQAIYSGWLPDSGFKPKDSPSFELYHNDPKTHPEGKHVVDICLPVSPM